MVARAELQRILQMLQAEVVKANWSIKHHVCSVP